MKKKAQSKPRLLVLDGEIDQPPIYFELEDGEAFTFGRNPACEMPVKDIAASRRHCRIVYTGKNYTLEDLGSHNGTFVNDLPVKNHRLKHGETIRIGNSYFVFLLDEDDGRHLINAQLDDGMLVTNSTIRLFAGASNTEFTSDLRVLVKLGTVTNEIKEPEALQRAILEIILELVPARRGAILLTAEDLADAQSVCVTANYHGFSEATMQISRTVSEQVLHEPIALLSNDLTDKNLNEAESLIASRVSSLLCVPLKTGERKGLIYLDADDPQIRFTETHLEQVSAISYLASAALANAESIERLRQEKAILQDSLQIETNLVGESAAIKNISELIAKVAPTDSIVLISGETGTGKELVARAVHQNSPRGDKPFLAINCAALNANLLETELFGHEKGAFTGALGLKKGKLEVAGSGTLFLDEIGDLAPELQVKLLRVIQEREFERVGGIKTLRVHARIIAATNQDLETLVKEGRFRKDLFFRLNVVPVKVPPLRERRSDIPLLIRHFIHKYGAQCHRRITGVSGSAEKLLVDAEWNGNVRELENVIERAVVLGTGDEITPEDLPSEMLGAATAFKGDFNEQLKQAKRKIIVTAVIKSNGNFSEAARLLRMHPNNMHRLAQQLEVKQGLRATIEES